MGFTQTLYIHVALQSYLLQPVALLQLHQDPAVVFGLKHVFLLLRGFLCLNHCLDFGVKCKMPVVPGFGIWDSLYLCKKDPCFVLG